MTAPVPIPERQVSLEVDGGQTALPIPGAELHILPRTGHYLWLEEPGALRDLLAAFVARFSA